MVISKNCSNQKPIPEGLQYEALHKHTVSQFYRKSSSVPQRVSMRGFFNTNTARSYTSDDLRDTGIPNDLATFLLSVPPKGRGFAHLHERMHRHINFSRRSFEDSEKLKRMWRTLEREQAHQGAIVDLFSNVPETPGNPPLLLLARMPRSIDPGEERSRRNALVRRLNDLEDFFATPSSRKKRESSLPHTPGSLPSLLKHQSGATHSKEYWQLDFDARCTSPEAAKASSEFEETRLAFLTGLHKFRVLLEVADPLAKMPTKQWKADDASTQSYIVHISMLNHFLRSPKHAALALLASVSHPDVPITADSVRKAWVKNADKNPFF